MADATPAAPAADATPAAPAADSTPAAPAAAGASDSTPAAPAADVKPATTGEPVPAAASAVVEATVTGAPETYADFTLPEGLTAEGLILDTDRAFFKELGLTQAQAQQMVDKKVALVQAREAAAEGEFTQLVDGWRAETMADKDIGGDNFEKSKQSANAALKAFGTPALDTLFKDFGIGNHPEVVRIFARIGKLLREDQPGTIGQEVTPKPDRVEQLYGTQKPTQ